MIDENLSRYTGHSEDAPVSKFRILGCKNEYGVGIISIGLLDYELSLSIISNNIILVSLFLLICSSIMVSMDMISLFKTITSISSDAPPKYWTIEDVRKILICGLIAEGWGRL
ncbi:unnamed protein product [Lactuca saligna]|uniref:Uncharacterized protein n=1 Tax=Lactuca saligna TaxID=75948 RepID=A0AA35ZVU5_LACSI|nr:unnamed protein product [Lactuca saligna]